MATVYNVTYVDNEGKLHIETRDTVERGYALYKSYCKDPLIKNVKLLEICNHEIYILRDSETDYKL